jgi:hypothetical protein
VKHIYACKIATLENDAGAVARAKLVINEPVEDEYVVSGNGGEQRGQAEVQTDGDVSSAISPLMPDLKGVGRMRIMLSVGIGPAMKKEIAKILKEKLKSNTRRLIKFDINIDLAWWKVLEKYGGGAKAGVSFIWKVAFKHCIFKMIFNGGIFVFYKKWEYPLFELPEINVSSFALRVEKKVWGIPLIATFDSWIHNCPKFWKSVDFDVRIGFSDSFLWWMLDDYCVGRGGFGKCKYCAKCSPEEPTGCRRDASDSSLPEVCQSNSFGPFDMSKLFP